ncbi:MAG: hypothetical protein AAF664_19465 [Planctomycetota bacterium]
MTFLSVGCQPDGGSSADSGASGEEHDHDHGDHDHGEHEDGDHEGGDHDHGDHGHDHDHGHGHDEPTTIAEAIEHTRELAATIKAGFEAKEPESVHGALHEIGNALGQLETMVKKAEMPEDAAAAANAAVEDLFSAFGDLDDTLHDRGEATFDSVSEKIDAAFATLEGK